MNRLGRALGSGKLSRLRRGEGEPAWYLDWKAADGVRKRQLLSRDKRTAERLRLQIISERDLELAGLGTTEGQNRSLAEVKELYFQDLSVRCSQSHVRNARLRIERVLAGVRVERVRDLQANHVLQHRARRLASGAGARTVNHETLNLKSMLTWAVRAGLLALNPLQSLQLLPVGRQAIRYQRRALAEEEIARFLQAAHEDDQAGDDRVAAKKTIEGGTKGKKWSQRPRDERVPQYPLWLAFLETGARYYELTHVRWADLDLAGLTITLRGETTKNSKTRVLPLRAAVLEELLALRPIHERGLGRQLTGHDPVFRSPPGEAWPRSSRNALRVLWRVLERAGIERKDSEGRVIDIHALRHSCATRLARAGVPITFTQKLLGHSTIELTARYYTHVEVNDLRVALERVGVEGVGARAG